MKREVISLALNGLSDRHITDTADFCSATVYSTPERKPYMKKKRILTFALAAVLLIALGISAYAIWGTARCTGTYQMPKTAEYTSLSNLPGIERDVGYPVKVPEQFSNGYAFVRLRVDGEAVFGENYEVLKEYYSVNVTYAREGAGDLTLHLSPVLDCEGSSEAPARMPGEERTVGDVSVKLNRDHYKAVPEDYEKTQDDLKLEAAGHYYISFGADEIEEHEIVSADFTLGNVSYILMDMEADEDSFETLIRMAGEIIDTANR